MAWLFKTVVEGLLGLRYEYGGLRLCPAFPSEWDKASLTLERENTVYNIKIINKNTGSKKIYVNDTLINGDFVEFSNIASVEIRIEL